MTIEEFNIWINGYLELTNENFLNKHQLTIIKNHANLVEAVMGYQDEKMKRLITTLEEQMASKNQIPLSILKAQM